MVVAQHEIIVIRELALANLLDKLLEVWLANQLLGVSWREILLSGRLAHYYGSISNWLRQYGITLLRGDLGFTYLILQVSSFVNSKLNDFLQLLVLS